MSRAIVANLSPETAAKVRPGAMLAWLAGGLLLAAASVGCGGKYDLRPATGRILAKDGTPLGRMRVVLEPTDAQMGTSSLAITDGDGEFELGTLKRGDGAQPGTYRVAVIDAVAQNAMDRSLLRIHPRYQEVETSGLEITVDENRNEFELVLDPP